MIRTETVELTSLKAIAYRHKITSGGSGITIIRPDYSQPGIASISTKTGEPIPSVNTNTKMFPKEAFEEAMDLTRALPYKNLGNIKVKDVVIEEPEVELSQEEEKELEFIVDSEDYQKIIDYYTDKNGKLSLDLMSKDFIKFLKSSSVVADMVAERKSEASIRNYVISHKFKDITGNQNLSSEQLKQIVDLLNESSNKSIYKDLNEEIRKLLNTEKRK